MSTVVNEIFALPLSLLFIIALAFSIVMWYFVVEMDKLNLVVMASVMTGMSMALLMWASTVGDQYWHARAMLLTPDVSLGLLKSMGRDEQVVFARALERTQLGMDIVNVTPVQNNLLQSIFLRACKA